MKSVVLSYFRKSRLSKVLFITLLAVFLFFMFTISSFNQFSFDQNVVNQLSNRKLIVTKDGIIDSFTMMELKELDYVIDVYPSYGEIDVAINDTVFMKLSYQSAKEITSILGKKIDEIQENEIIVPINFLNERYQIGDDMTVVCGDIHYNFLIAGAYQSEYYQPFLLVHQNVMKNIAATDNSDAFVVIIDSYYHYADIKSLLEQNSYHIEFYNASHLGEIESYHKAMSVVNVMIIFLIGLTFIYLLLVLFHSVVSESYEIALMKVQGYSNKNIIMILFWRLLFIIGIALMILFVMIHVGYFISCLLEDQLSYCHFFRISYTVHVKHFLLITVLFVIILLATILALISRINKIQLIQLLKEDV